MMHLGFCNCSLWIIFTIGNLVIYLVFVFFFMLHKLEKENLESLKKRIEKKKLRNKSWREKKERILKEVRKEEIKNKNLEEEKKKEYTKIEMRRKKESLGRNEPFSNANYQNIYRVLQKII